MVYGNLYNKCKGTDIYSQFKSEVDISDSLVEEDVIFESDNDTSLYVEALSLILSENNNFNFIIEESFGDRLVNQLKRLDPTSILSTIVEKFISILKALWNQFEALCIGILSKAGAIKRYKNSILKLSEAITYNAPHYNYTNIREDKSRTDFDTEINARYDLFLSNLNSIKSLSSFGDIQSKIEDINTTFDDGVFYYDSLRGKIIGKETCVKDNYAKELYKYFRDGQSEPIEEDIISVDTIKTKLNNLETTKNTKAISKTRADVEKQANKMKAKYRSTKLTDYIGNNEKSTEIESLYKKCIQLHITNTQEICNTYLQYYAAKLDAAKEEYSNDIKILYRAAQEAVRKGL